MIAARPRRSALYMPAANPRAIEKARDLACDVVILDLEDSVAPDAKGEARDLAVAAVKAGGFGRREVVIRVNGLDTPWGADDLRAAASVSPDAVLVPKVNGPADLAAYARELADGARLWAMMETCAAVFALDAIAGFGGPLETLVIGGNDLAKEMRCKLTVERAPLQGILGLAVAAGRAHGLCLLDGVFNGIEDDAGLERQCLQGLDFGFDGKTLIHPRQIEAANRAFTPDPESVDWSRTIVAAFDSPENAGKGVLKVEGRMVERLHLEEARRLIAVAEAIAEA
ncbi:MAG TPA: CoA ester lyase [Phenylobacterium sp.]|nr:CoA ester lyase [Phenylobacterium sp.]